MPQWMARLKVESNALAAANTNAISIGNLNVVNPAIQAPAGTMVATTTTTPSNIQNTQLLGTIDCYEDVFKEITKKLYGDESGVTITGDILDSSVASMTGAQPIVYETASDLFRQDGTVLTSNAGGQLAIVASGTNGLPAGTILVQRRLQDDKGRIWTIEGLPNAGEQITFATVANSSVIQQTHQTPIQQHQPSQSVFEERWFESDEQLTWTQSKIARYNPAQKVFRCVDCDFVGFLSRVAEHWLGNHADLRVFQCPRCPYTSAWARCVRMHLTRQHGETLQDNSLWKENPVLEEVTKFLNTLKTKVEQKSEPVNANGDKRYTCPYCPYQTDRRDLYNRHENIHRDEKPFVCYVCEKQFNRADHVKKHFMRMHRDHTYDINKIRKTSSKPSNIQFYNGAKVDSKQDHLMESDPVQILQSSDQILHPIQPTTYEQVQIKQEHHEHEVAAMAAVATTSVDTIVQLQPPPPTTNHTVVQQIPHIAYFNPTPAPGQTGPLQGIPGVGGNKKEVKMKGKQKKKSGEKMYTCSYCPWQGVDNWCLKRHLNTHIKPFLCALCDYKAARSERLATHVLKVHNKRVCHKCSFLADDTESLSQHIQDSHQNPLVKTGFNCNVCQEYFELRADLEAHAILEHQKVIVQCDLCDFRTTDELSMEAHLRDKHNLTPGMGAVAAAAAAAAAAAIGQPVTSQFTMHVQTQSQVHLTESVDASEQLLSQAGLLTSSIASGTSVTNYPGTSSNLQEKPVENGSELEPDEPKTLCEKCGIDFVDVQSTKLHQRRHEAPAEDKKELSKSPGTKRFSRTYMCSTCSYTCATKNIMMQHQRAHTGFELVCKAEKCMFSTPFDNTLKEHVQNDHGTEEFVRCPHCGLRMPSNNAFTTHWRFHHKTICSLCVNIYRLRYDVKENDVHDVICKHQSPSCPEVDNSSMIFKLETSGSSTDLTSGLSLSDHRLEDLAGLVIPDVLDEPLMKKPKLDSSVVSAASTLYKRESIRLLPRLVEVTVTPVPPVVKSSCSSSHRKRKRRLKINYTSCRNNEKRRVKNATSATRMNKVLFLIQKIEASRRSGDIRVSRVRRYCQKGTFSWLYRNPREGYKCLSPLCENKCSWRYPRKVGLVLHNLWYHRIARFKCDICGLQFPHLYQAFLHKIVQHADFLQQQQNNKALQVAAQFLGQAQLAVVDDGQNHLLSQ